MLSKPGKDTLGNFRPLRIALRKDCHEVVAETFQASIARRHADYLCTLRENVRE